MRCHSLRTTGRSKCLGEIRDSSMTKRSKAWTYGAGGSIATLKSGSLSNINKS